MDESLSDFEEKKQNRMGPKHVSKAKVSIKKRKQIKGQRDIRTLVRSTKNELVTYTKDFDHMCKTSGIDVDSEQLQLAIALSKSLHDSESQVDVGTITVKPLSALERTKKIKSTLQEYGFKVPTCVLKKTSKRLISNKQYKLLTTPECEKNKIICSKYSEVLRRNHPNLKNHGVIENSDKEIYNKATNISYNQIKNVEEFYIQNSLIEKSTHETCLLKDWSAIPGRPISPDLRVSNFKFHEFEFTQDELDCILSSTLQLAQEIVNRKTMTSCDKKSTQETLNEGLNIHIDLKPHNDCKNKQLRNSFEHPSDINKNMDATQGARSASPDLFEGDEYSLEGPNHSQHSEIKTSTSNKDNMYSMDLTECVSSITYKEQTIVQSDVCKVSGISKKLVPESNSYLHDEVVQFSIDYAGLNDACNKEGRFTRSTQKDINLHTDIPSQTELSTETIMEVNDLMEVTECVVSDFNQQNMHNIQHSSCYNSSLQDKKSMSKLNTINIKKLNLNNKDVQPVYSHNIIEKIDLTQTMVGSVDCLTEDYIERLGYDQENETMPLDLIQSSSSNEDLPMVQLSDTKLSSEDTIIIYGDDVTNNISFKDVVLDTEISKESVTKDISNEKISLSKDSVSINEMPPYEENIDFLSDNDNAVSNSPIDNDDTIDLTQSPELSTQTHHISESLGKQNNVSIDYDELYDMNASTSDTISKNNYTIRNESLYNIGKQKNLSCESEKSLQICSLEISKKYKYLSDEENINNISLNNSILPNVEVKSICKETKVISKSCESQSTPQKLSGNKSVVHTPVNDEYIVKTDSVTPMLDYSSMTTPARNKELEKYGLKPFKRKRAIQMLTYLYNQTHPVVEQCALDEIPSTSKKPKVSEEEIKKKSTAHKHQVAIFEDHDLSKENLYAETKENPDIKEIDCSPEDWVFQTRENTKVHSCRVPLHIVFHNYVSCRSMLRAAILRYEPINIDVIHKDLIANGFRYNPKDILKFMDKKCITVKTAENKTRNQKI